MCKHPIWEGRTSVWMVGWLRRSAMETMERFHFVWLSVRCFVGQRVVHSSVGVYLECFFRVLVFYYGHVRVCVILQLLSLRLAFLVLLFLSSFLPLCCYCYSEHPHMDLYYTLH